MVKTAGAKTGLLLTREAPAGRDLTLNLVSRTKKANQFSRYSAFSRPLQYEYV